MSKSSVFHGFSMVFDGVCCFSASFGRWKDWQKTLQAYQTKQNAHRAEAMGREHVNAFVIP